MKNANIVQGVNYSSGGELMLFDPRPKFSKNELFDRDTELKLLDRGVKNRYPLILLTGVRRIGKTSLLNVFLNEIEYPSVVVDLRDLKPNYGLRDLYGLLSHSLSTRLDKLIDVLKGIRGVKILGMEVELSWKGRDSISLSTLFDYLNKERMIIAFDEAQKLVGPRSRLMLEALAHAYDYNENLTFIMTGSEVGLLYEFLGIDNRKSPLFGRYIYEVRLRRFSPEESKEFLRRGFEEAGVNVGEDILEEAVKLFDGIPGWLTFFGNHYANIRGSSLGEIKDMAVRVAQEELKRLVETRGRRYLIVMKAIARGAKTWSQVKRKLEEAESSTISNSVLSNILNSLEKLSIIKDYEFLDPIYREAAKLF